MLRGGGGCANGGTLAKQKTVCREKCGAGRGKLEKKKVNRIPAKKKAITSRGQAGVRCRAAPKKLGKNLKLVAKQNVEANQIATTADPLEVAGPATVARSRGKLERDRSRMGRCQSLKGMSERGKQRPKQNQGRKEPNQAGKTHPPDLEKTKRESLVDLENNSEPSQEKTGFSLRDGKWPGGLIKNRWGTGARLTEKRQSIALTKCSQEEKKSGVKVVEENQKISTWNEI